MTVSVGTFEDLQPDRGQPVDRSPSFPCDGPCGRSFDWRGYWKVRHVNLGGDPRDAPFLCDECLATAIQYHDRATRNRRLDEFQEGDA